MVFLKHFLLGLDEFTSGYRGICCLEVKIICFIVVNGIAIISLMTQDDNNLGCTCILH